MKAFLHSLPNGVNWTGLSCVALLAWGLAYLVTPWAWLVMVPNVAAEAFKLWVATKIAARVLEQVAARTAAFEAQLEEMLHGNPDDDATEVAS